MEGRRQRNRIDAQSEPEFGPRIVEHGGGTIRHVQRHSPPFETHDQPRVPTDVVILIPVFNDWDSIAKLLPALDAVLARSGMRAGVLVVDDGSTLDPDPIAGAVAFGALARVDVLCLRRNLGHQRAIAVGLAYVEDCLGADCVVIMDGDGEDDPDDVPRLLARLAEEKQRKIIFAERKRRSESLGFRIFYALYKTLHLALTGKGVRVGNFSAIPRRRLSSLVVVAELWNHYAAAVFRSRQPYCMIPTRRSARLAGRSSMNFVSLVAHGLSAISVYSDVVGVRLLVAAVLLAIVTLAGIAAAVIIRLATSWAIPGWASYTVGLLLVLFVQSIMAALVFSFGMLGSRHGSTFLPRRDYSYFIGSIWTVHGPERSLAPLPLLDPANEVVLPAR
jgi:glycosyltransferase involved in cell wall biosynthesis